MVYFLAASSVHHAIAALNPEQQSKYKGKVYALPGLSLNPYAKNPKKNSAKFAFKRTER